MLPALEPCRIYVHDAHAATGIQLPPRYSRPNWEHNQYSAELWLQRAVEHHPWRVLDARAADMLYVSSNLSLWCVAGKGWTIRRFWKALAVTAH